MSTRELLSVLITHGWEPMVRAPGRGYVPRFTAAEMEELERWAINEYPGQSYDD